MQPQNLADYQKIDNVDAQTQETIVTDVNADQVLSSIDQMKSDILSRQQEISDLTDQLKVQEQVLSDLAAIGVFPTKIDNLPNPVPITDPLPIANPVTTATP